MEEGEAEAVAVEAVPVDSETAEPVAEETPAPEEKPKRKRAPRCHDQTGKIGCADFCEGSQPPGPETLDRQRHETFGCTADDHRPLGP